MDCKCGVCLVLSISLLGWDDWCLGYRHFPTSREKKGKKKKKEPGEEMA